jgi:hypothetical protein
MPDTSGVGDTSEEWVAPPPNLGNGRRGPLLSWKHGRTPTATHQETTMPRFLVERTFPEGLHIPVNNQGADVCMSVVGTNAKSGVTWVHSYVSDDLKKTFCIYDAPTPDAIRETARNNNLPIDSITAVSVLDPYFYRG